VLVEKVRIIMASTVAQRSVGQIVDQSAWSPYQKLIVALAALAFAVDGLANQVLGLAIPSLVRDWSQPRGAFASVAALGLVGVTIGAAVGGIAGDRLGRRFGLIGSVLLFGAATAASSLAHDIPQLLVLRLVAGLGIGGAIPNCAALVTEFTPARSRSLGLAIALDFIPVGGWLSGLIGSYLLPAEGWRGLFLTIGLLPIGVAVLFFFLLPESPRFLSNHPSRRNELLRILRRCRCEVHADASLIEDRGEGRRNHLAMLFAPGIAASTVALWTGFFFCLLASYSMFSWIPSMLAGQGFSLQVTSFGMTAFNFGGMAGGLIGGLAIGWSGSRWSVPILAAGAAIGAAVLGLLPLDPRHGFTLASCALIAEGLFIAGLHNGLYTLAAYIYPPYMRATGVGSAAAVGRIGAILSSYTGVLSLELGGESAYFIVISSAVVVALVAILMIRVHIPANAR
jgi:AAHS family 4-hydroxybenzoate transporter-like MFS transporter